MDRQAYIKAKIDLYNIIANHAYNDYVTANTNKNGKPYKKRRCYTLSDDAKDALEIYKMLTNNSHNSITLEQEEKIKGFLLIYRLYRTEFLEDRGGKEYYKNAI